jgi:RNA recognition motif-containing protein
MNIYVGNLSFGVSEQALKGLFSTFGDVTSVKIITDRDTGESRGFAFVEMASGGNEAIEGLNGHSLEGRSITVNEARPREERGGSGGGFGGGRSGGPRRGGGGGFGGGGGRRDGGGGRGNWR